MCKQRKAPKIAKNTQRRKYIFKDGKDGISKGNSLQNGVS
jgi:hypothetical protein